jgi:hypothetical protein
MCIYSIPMSLSPIKEDITPEPETPSNDSSPPGAVTALADISDQISNPSETNTNDAADSPIESAEIQTPVVAPSMNAIAENPPFLTSGPPQVFTAPTEVPPYLNKAINFRRTLKHKKRAEYEGLSDSDKLVAKKQIVDNMIRVLRSSTQKTTFQHHKKSIVKLRHTFNKHLDYIETKKRVKSVKKNEKSNDKKSRRSKSIQ